MEFYLKFISTNSRMIKFINSLNISDELKLKKISFYRNLNEKLFSDVYRLYFVGSSICR